MRLLLVLLMLSPLTAWAEGLRLPHDDWTAGDSARQGVLSAVIVADWLQTRHLTEPHPQAAQGVYYVEKGRASYFIGEHPTKHQVDRYFAASLVLAAGVAYVLPRGWRDAFQYIYIGNEITIVRQNLAIGLHISY